MGQRKSKPSKTSYDVAPVVSERDFQFENNRNNNEKNGTPSKKPPTANTADAKWEIASSTLTSNYQTEAQKDAAEKTFDPKLIPAWLKAELFTDILKVNLPGFERISEFKAYPALSAGENYATLMLRVSIDAELNDKSVKNISFMLKVSHDNDQMREMLKIANFFVTENAMYLDVLPELEQMYKDVGVDIKLSAKAYKFPEEAEPNAVLLQDLRPFGFKNANRRECLDMEHAHWVLQKLAQYHAASATRVATKGPYPDIFMKGVFTDRNQAIAIWDAMMVTFKANFLNNLKHFKDGEKYEKPMTGCLNDLTKNIVALSEYDEDEFNALSHGDCWTNNILFKYNDEGEVIDMMFVDYQMSKFDSVAHDLWYFILSSLKLDIKLNKFDYLIRYYYDNLIESLELLKYPNKLPALREIYIQLFKYGAWTTFTTIVILPVVLLDPTDVATMENFMSTDEDGMAFKNALFANKRYHEHINEILPWLYNRGMLEPYDFSKPNSSDDNKACDNKIESQETKATSVTEAPPKGPPAFKSPDWINERTFIDVLQQNFKDFKSIKDFKTSAATSGGDNYASNMIKVDIDFELENAEPKSASYMLKIGLDDEHSKAMLAMLNPFVKEISMYKEYIPKFEALYKAAGLDLVFAPKSFDLPQKPVEDVVVLENMRPSGFKNADRLAGLDENHIKATLHKLAQFHAASACYALEHPFPEPIKKSLFHEDSRDFFMKMQELFTSLFLECVESFEHQEEYFEKLNKINDVYFDAMLDAAKVDENDFNVLNHGDVWTNNILFKYDEAGNIENTYLIDYQIVNYGSPAYDLYYFLISSPSLDNKVAKFDQHIKFYHDQLVRHLTLLEYPRHIPTLKELHEDLIRRGAFAFSVALGVMTAVLLDPTELANIGNLLSDADAGTALRKQMYNNKRYKDHADTILVWLNHRGVLDFDIIDSVSSITATDWAAPIFEVPTWLNETYFTDILAGNVKGFAHITNFKSELATKAGDNYASIVTKVDVEVELKGESQKKTLKCALKNGTKKQLNYILKTPPNGGQATFLLETWNYFQKENELYNQYIPAFETMYEKAGEIIRIAPAHFKFTKEIDCDTVLLENLRSRGYSSADRLECLGMEHTKSVLRKLAQFHAASVKFIENGGTYPTCFNDGMYNERAREMFVQIMQGTNKTILEAITRYDGSEEYADKIPHLLDAFLDQAIKLNKVDSTDFNVLNHADCWVNNIMFQYDEAGGLKETFLIDFQDCKYGSPAVDLYYFIISSVKLDIKVEQFDYLIKYYYDSLLKHLALLDYKGNVPMLAELQESLIKYGFYGVSALLGVTSLCLLDPTKNMSIDAVLGEDDTSKYIRTNMYSNPRYKAHAEKILLWLNRRGSLDF